MRPFAILTGALGILAVGCGVGGQVEGPTRVVRSYAGALQRGDADGAWGLLDEDARRGRTRDDHTALVTANAAELRDQGEALERAARTDAMEARARVPLASGETVVLVLEDGRWRIDGGLLDAAGLGTPQDAVAALRRALMRRDLPGVERVLSRQTRAEWEEEVRRVVESTEDVDDLEVEIQGNRARVRTTGGGSIELVRESGEWRVVDIFGR
jgi:ketosteroid isomerase-like protein